MTACLALKHSMRLVIHIPELLSCDESTPSSVFAVYGSDGSLIFLHRVGTAQAYSLLDGDDSTLFGFMFRSEIVNAKK